jgi:hypothetical protein
MNQHDDAMWDKAVDAAGATEQRLRAAEHLLREVTPSQLSAATIDTMMMAATRDAATHPRGHGRLLAATMMLVIGLSAAAWRSTQVFWPEQSIARENLHGVLHTAMTAPTGERRFAATVRLDDVCGEIIDWLGTLTANEDECADAARDALTNLRATLSGTTAFAIPTASLEHHLDIATRKDSSMELRRHSTRQVGAWASFAIRAILAAPLTDKAANQERDACLRRILGALSK